jgi:hypothetical protein
MGNQWADTTGPLTGELLVSWPGPGSPPGSLNLKVPPFSGTSAPGEDGLFEVGDAGYAAVDR